MEERKYRIGEAGKMLNLKTYVLRFWETEFPQLDPHRTEKGQRLYSEKDIALLRTIRHLLHERGLTIEGARKALDEHISLIMQDSGGEKSLPESVPSGERIGASFTASAVSAVNGAGTSNAHPAGLSKGNTVPCDPASNFPTGDLPPEADARLGPVQGLLYDVAQAVRSVQSVEPAESSHHHGDYGHTTSGDSLSSERGSRTITEDNDQSADARITRGAAGSGRQPSAPDTALLQEVIGELEELRNLLVQERQQK